MTDELSTAIQCKIKEEREKNSKTLNCFDQSIVMPVDTNDGYETFKGASNNQNFNSVHISDLEDHQRESYVDVRYPLQSIGFVNAEKMGINLYKGQVEMISSSEQCHKEKSEIFKENDLRGKFNVDDVEIQRGLDVIERLELKICNPYVYYSGRKEYFRYGFDRIKQLSQYKNKITKKRHTLFRIFFQLIKRKPLLNIDKSNALKWKENDLKSKAFSGLISYLAKRKLLVIKFVQNFNVIQKLEKYDILINRLRYFGLNLMDNNAEYNYIRKLYRNGGIVKSNLEINKNNYTSKEIQNKNEVTPQENILSTKFANKSTKNKKQLKGHEKEKMSNIVEKYMKKDQEYIDMNRKKLTKMYMSDRMLVLELKKISRDFLKKDSKNSCESCNFYA